MYAQGTLTQGAMRNFLEENEALRPKNKRRNAGLIDRSIMMPAAGRALLVVK
jgi:hypothetical protein